MKIPYTSGLSLPLLRHSCEVSRLQHFISLLHTVAMGLNYTFFICELVKSMRECTYNMTGWKDSWTVVIH